MLSVATSHSYTSDTSNSSVIDIVVIVIVVVALTMNRFEIADDVKIFAVNSR